MIDYIKIYVDATKEEKEKLQDFIDKRCDIEGIPHMDFEEVIKDYIDKYGTIDVLDEEKYNSCGELVLTYDEALEFLE